MGDERHRFPSMSHPPAPLPRPRDLDEALDRLQALETWMALHSQDVKARLDAGAGTMGELKAAVHDLRPKRAALIAWAGPLIGVLSIVFTAGGFPNRSEFEKAGDRWEAQVEKVREDIRALEKEAVRGRGSIDAFQAELAAFGARLDQQLQQAQRDRGRSR
jgi:hypothetical protein